MTLNKKKIGFKLFTLGLLVLIMSIAPNGRHVDACHTTSGTCAINGAGFLGVLAFFGMAQNGEPACSTTRGEHPVFFANGSKVEWVTDISIPGVGLSLNFNRTYKSRRSHNNRMGYNWFHNHDFRIQEELNTSGDTDIYVVYPDGYRRKFTYNAGDYDSPVTVYSQLTYNSTDDEYDLTTKNGTIFTFDAAGPLVSIEDRNGNKLEYSYEMDGPDFDLTDIRGNYDLDNEYIDSGWLPAGAPIIARAFKLIKIEETNSKVTGFLNGRYLNFTYFADGDPDNTGNWKTGRIKKVTDHLGREWQYDYDTNGNLTKVTTPATDEFPAGQVTEYSYSSGYDDNFLNHNLTAVKDGRGNTYKTIVYSNDDRVISETIGGDTVYFHYDVTEGEDYANSTIYTNRRGIRTEYTFDTFGRVKEVEQADNPYFDTEYYFVDGAGANAYEYRLIKNPRDNTSRFEYDPVGNMTMSRWRDAPNTTGTDGDSPENDLITTMAYNDASEFYTLATRTDPEGNVTYLYYDFDESPGNDLNDDGITDGTDGNLVQIMLPQVDTDGDGTPDANPLIKFQYNSYGQRIKVIDPEGIVTEYQYYTTGNNWGYLEKIIVDPSSLALTTTFTYDQVGNPITIQDPRSNTTTYAYNNLNFVTKITSASPFSYETEFTYDGNNNITQLDITNKDQDGIAQGDGLVTTTFQYDTLNNIIQLDREEEDGVYNTWYYEYDPNENLTLVTLPEGNMIRYEYEERDLLAKEHRAYSTADEAVTSYFYDYNGNLTSIEDPQDAADNTSKESYFCYDPYDRLLQAQDEDSATGALEDGNRWEFIYDKNSNRTMAQYSDDADTILAETHYAFDAINRLTEIKRKLWGLVDGAPLVYGSANDVITKTLYYKNSLVKRQTYPEGDVMAYEFDDANRLKKEITYEQWNGGSSPVTGLEIEYTLDGNGNPTTIARKERDQVTTNTITYNTTNVFDVLNRLTSSTDNASKETEFFYDSRGNLVETEDAEDNTVRNVYDLRDRLLNVIEDYRDSLGDITSSTYTTYEYDGNGNLTRFLDDHYNSTLYLYDDLDRRTKIVYPDNSSRDYEYNYNSLITKITDENGSYTDFTYNYKDQLTSQATTKATGVQGEDYVAYTYDGMYRMLTAENKTGGSSGTRMAHNDLTYDSLSRIVEDKQSIKAASQKTVAYQWDDNSNVKKITYPGSRVIDYEFDEMDRITAIKESTSNIALYDYQAYKERQKDLLNGANSVIAYGTGQQVASIIDQDSSTNDIVNFTYAHDDVYNITSERHNHASGDPGDAYKYDSTYRLTKARYGVSDPANYNWTTDSGSDKHNFAYDEVDNRTSVARTGESTKYYQANLLNQYPEIDTTKGEDVDNRTYDLNGNLTENENGVVYIFDYQNRLVKATKTDDYRVSFEYDSRGRRTYKKSESWTGSAWQTDNEEYFYYVGDEIVEERDDSDIIQRTYVLSDTLDMPIQMTEEDEAGDPDYYFHYNSLGSVYKLTDASENIVEEYSYDSYGNLSIDTDDADVHNPYFYTGRRYDSESGLYYYRTRHYDPATGGFLQRDLAGYLDSSSLYAYCSGNPVNSIDPFGLHQEHFIGKHTGSKGEERMYYKHKGKYYSATKKRSYKNEKGQTVNQWHGEQANEGDKVREVTSGDELERVKRMERLSKHKGKTLSEQDQILLETLIAIYGDEELYNKIKEGHSLADIACEAAKNPANILLLALGMKKFRKLLPTKLTRAGKRKIGNLSHLKDISVSDAIKFRGGGQSQVRQVASHLQKKSVGEVANAAAKGDAEAETAIKMIKQAAKKAQDH
ncbi:RHS repeat-associated core domain-containing protein [Planctomycetota bacterium]